MTKNSSSSDLFKDHESFRQYLVDHLKRQVLGPDAGASDEDKRELLAIPPLQLYATGVLFPQKVYQEQLEDSEPRDDSGTDSVDDGDLETPTVEEGKRNRSAGSDQTTSSYEAEPLNLANEFSPSAVGISFRVEGQIRLRVAISYGTYSTEEYQEAHPRAGETSVDGTTFPTTRSSKRYRRTHHRHVLDVDIPSTTGALTPLDIEGSESGLKLHIMVRNRLDNSLVVSAMAVNHKVSGGRIGPDNADCFFQIEMDVTQADGDPVFLTIDRDGGSASDEEMASLELLYRHKRAFALGHGVAGDWSRDETLSAFGSVDRVSTAAVPVYDLKPIKPRSGGDLDPSMRFLFVGDGRRDGSGILEALAHLATEYERWIQDVEKQANSLSDEFRDAVDRHLENCKTCLKRIGDGIQALSEDPVAFLAFRLMNKAMLMQQFHSSVLGQRELGTEFPAIPEDYRDLPGGDRKWRLFQLAFILMNIVGMVNEGHPERRLIDLIWFPTGGGKTEAYLGLAAFTIAYERLHGRATGTTVLMRYTLRLLTAQQFQRASALILSLDAIRRDNDLGANLGEEKISIGLWVGKSLSPNTRTEARGALRKLKRDQSAQNPFQVLNCPWCGVDFTNRKKFGYAEIVAGSGERTVKLICPDDACRYGAAGKGMPIDVIDEDLYDAPPTLLIGTVDKFAQISWSNTVGRLFGIGLDLPPPSLIIQDELHLISGPLGSMVGLYETAIDRLCARDGHVHKIVASTATIRRAAEQCHDLYDRDTFEFPPQGIRAGDSYFAYEDTESPGRLYVGVMATAVKSHQTALVRACSPLLQGVCRDQPDKDDESDNANVRRSLVDPYGTIVWYFNSLRELGHAATLCTGDIPEYLKGLCHRLGVTAEQRRYVREIVELTSRRTADEIPEILNRLEIPWRMNPKGRYPIDVLLATNMIAVGVDVPRLGLIVMSGQPKSASEYIQATSRVGRQFPGLVVTVYTQNKSRDRSHYERFVAYHQSIYKYVEPTSVTPFSPQARERGLRGLLIALARQMAGVDLPDQIADKEAEVRREIQYILSRIESRDHEERDDAESELDEWLSFWKAYQPPIYGQMGGGVNQPTLAYPFGSTPHAEYQRDAWPLMTSMRNVDGTCSARVLNVFEIDESTGDQGEN